MLHNNTQQYQPLMQQLFYIYLDIKYSLTQKSSQFERQREHEFPKPQKIDQKKKMIVTEFTLRPHFRPLFPPELASSFTSSIQESGLISERRAERPPSSTSAKESRGSGNPKREFWNVCFRSEADDRHGAGLPTHPRSTTSAYL